MQKKLSVLIAFFALGIYLFSGRIGMSTAQDTLATFKDNNCVECHSKIMNPLSITSRYAEWHISVHKDKGVSCDKCHGGNATTGDKNKAHAGILPSKDSGSKLHPKNVPATCNTCHEQISSTFTKSKHYQNLQSAGLGPSCTTCHAHMASEVIYTAEQTQELCAGCHDSSNALMPKRPEIPTQANEAMQSIRRANMVVLWALRLVEEAHNKKVDIGTSEQEMVPVKAALNEAKVGFHAFNMEAVRKKADEAFESGTKVKDQLRAKLYPGS